MKAEVISSLVDWMDRRFLNPDPGSRAGPDPDRAQREFAQLPGCSRQCGLPTADSRIICCRRRRLCRSRAAKAWRRGRPGEQVGSCFFPQGQEGLPMPVCNLDSHMPGDGIDGFAGTFRYGQRPALHAKRHAVGANV